MPLMVKARHTASIKARGDEPTDRPKKQGSSEGHICFVRVDFIIFKRKTAKCNLLIFWVAKMFVPF